MAKKPLPKRTITQSDLQLRGNILDEMQHRIQTLRNSGQAVPQEWHDKVSQVAESQDPGHIAETHTWMKDLPAKEYQTAEITWETFTMFAGELLDKLTLVAAREIILNVGNALPDNEVTHAIAGLLKEIKAIRSATDSPVIAMNELAKVRTKAKEYLVPGV